MPPSCFRPTPHDSARPSLHRVPAGPVPLLPRYYDALRLPTVHSAALRFLRLAVPRGRLRFAPAGHKRQPPAGQAIFMARLRPYLHVETAGPPTFLGNPLCLCPALRPRRDQRTRPFGTSARPPLIPRRGLLHWNFRGSITRLRHSLSTLRRMGRPTTTQDSLPAAGQALPDGLPTRRVPTKGFRVVSYISSSFPKLRGAKNPFSDARGKGFPPRKGREEILGPAISRLWR